MDRLLLLISAICLIPIALLYGFAPTASLPRIFGFDVVGVNEPHIFRAIMGLYLGQAVFLFMGVVRESLRRPALYMLTTFVWGLVAGRVLSLILDGRPNGLLLFYILLEASVGIVAVILLRNKP